MKLLHHLANVMVQCLLLPTGQILLYKCVLSSLSETDITYDQ